MLGILHHFREFLLSALKRCSSVHLLQYLLALCRAVFSRCKFECSGQDLSHEYLPKTLTLAEGKGSLSDEGIVNPVGHVISACRTPAQVEEGHVIPLSTRDGGCEDPPRKDVCITSTPPLKNGLRYMWTHKESLFSMLSFLDHLGFIQRSLAHTQIECSPADTLGQNNRKVWSTDVEKWRKFSDTYADHIQHVSLLATVLLAANMNFLAIQSIDLAPGGLSYLPQRFSYFSFSAALASIVMGSAVRSPRMFTNHGRFYSIAMVLTLSFPFQSFMFSLLSFLLALLTHCLHHKAVAQVVFGGTLVVLISCYLVIYWLITEPCNDIDCLLQRFVPVPREKRERAATTN